MRWTYSGKLRSELCRLPLNDRDVCLWAELWGLAGIASDVHGPILVHSHSAMVARRTFRLIKALGQDPVVAAGRPKYAIGFHQAMSVTWAAAVAQCPQGWLRGVFLSHGSMNDPDRGTHLEFWLGSPALVGPTQMSLERLGVKSATSPRRGGVTVYVNARSQAVRLLANLGAHSAVLEFENVRAMKSVKNRVNRLVNSETANLQRAVASGIEQARWLHQLRMSPQWDLLSPGMQALARLRMAHPEWSLRELGDRMEPILSKSAVNHRMRRLLQMAFSHSER